MTASMTGYARCALEGDWQELSWELRSVNSRYLDLNLYLPEEFRFVEAEVRSLLQNRLARGKVTAQLRWRAAAGVGSALNPNLERVAALSKALQQVSNHLPESHSPDALEILRWPGVLEEAATDYAALKAPILKLLNQALDEFIQHRRAEGARLAQMLRERAEQITTHVSTMQTRLPELQAAYREKLAQRVADAMAKVDAEVDAGRLEQELVLIAQRQDVSEELDRLTSHLTELEDTLQRKDAVGRRLDFLMQEFNREANTLGSKSQETEQTRVAVELKVLIEQMREQVQNIE